MVLFAEVILSTVKSYCLALVGVIAFALLLSSFAYWRPELQAEDGRVVPPSTPIPREFFGMHMHRVTTSTPWPSVPFGSWRLWDAACAWFHVEPQKGNWRWENLDKAVELAEQHHVDVLLTFGKTPQWASARPEEGPRSPSQKPGSQAEPKNLEDWRNYIRTVATRYKGRIHHYEIWNEPNLENFYTGTPDKMVELAREAYTTLKQVDPTIQVVSPSAVGPTGLPWLEKYLALGGGKYCDIVGYHFYVQMRPPEAMLNFINPVKKLMRQYDIADKPLWNTEAGWLGREGIPRRIDLEREAPGYVARAYLINWAEGVQRFFWYAWDDAGRDNVPMTLEDDHTPTAAARAYAEIESWMVGSTMDFCQSAGAGNAVCKLQRPNGHSAYIVWNRDGSGTFQVPANLKIRTITRLSGEQSAFEGNKLETGELPVMLQD